MNHSFTVKKGTVRGLHYQAAPHEEIKMVRCIAGAVFDIIVYFLKDYDTFIKCFGREISAVNKKMMYIPEGFGYGFQTYTENRLLVFDNSEI